MTRYKDILLDIEGRVAILTLNLPGLGNPISGDSTIGEIVEACKLVQNDQELSVLIITGAGDVFSAESGLDSQSENNQKSLEVADKSKFPPKNPSDIRRITLVIDELDVPTIAAVNGPAIGAGCDLTMMCDIRIASTNARFGEAFLETGMIPANEGSWFLTRLIGYSMAAELTFTGKVIDAEEALKSRLVSRVVPPDKLMEEATKLAKTIAKKPSHTLRMAKMLMKKSMRMDLKDFLDEYS